MFFYILNLKLLIQNEQKYEEISYLKDEYEEKSEWFNL